MPKSVLTAQDWILIVSEIADAIEARKDQLNELDGAIGDGDHGVSMSIGFRAVRETLAKLEDDQSMDRIFSLVGRTFLAAAGGAIGPLIGSMWMDTGKMLQGCEQFGPAECRRMLEAMDAAVVRRGKANLGDKTILDALHPAAVAARETQEDDLAAILKQAAEAAEAGAQATASMIARTGRSSRLGERTLGHQDAGATTLALILDTIYRAVAQETVKEST